MNALGLARHFDDAALARASSARELLAAAARRGGTSGLPAMLGLRDPHAVLADLEHRLGRRVFEIPTLPPSVPGMRLYEILRSALRAAGGRLVLGAEVVSHDATATGVTSVATHAAGRGSQLRGAVVRAGLGGFASGAIELDSHWVTHERVLGLPLRGRARPRASRGSSRDYLDEQPMARVGDRRRRRAARQGAENVVVAGAALPGAIAVARGLG